MQLEVSSIAFSYGKKEILRNVSFSLRSGESIALLGRNGSGKTTLMRLLLGFIKPEKGTIRIDGHDIQDMTNREKARNIAYIPQSLADVYPYTAEEAVLMGRASSLSLFSRPGKKDEKKAQEALDLLGIAHLRNRTVDTLSGGERQRVAIARALAAKPDILLADEPISSLDASLKAGLLNLLLDVRERSGMAIMIVEHDMRAAMSISDSIITLERGRISHCKSSPSQGISIS